MDQVWQSLAASGPLAIVLAVAVFTLWKQNQENQKEIKALQQQRIDDRKQLEDARLADRDACDAEKKKLNEDILTTVKMLATGVRKGATDGR